MPARKNKLTLSRGWQDKIRTTQLINRLQDHGLGKIELSSTQIKAIDVLLKKVTPDLAHMDLEGSLDNTVNVMIKQISPVK